MKLRERVKDVSFTQGAFWALTGIWPILSLRSFETITGPKRDEWLVKTIGGLIAVVGATLLIAGIRKRVTPEIALLGAGSALALGAADVIFTSRGRIRPVYLADAAVEAGFLAGWALQRPWRAQRRGTRNLKEESRSTSEQPGPIAPAQEWEADGGWPAP